MNQQKNGWHCMSCECPKVLECKFIQPLSSNRKEYSQSQREPVPELSEMGRRGGKYCLTDYGGDGKGSLHYYLSLSL